MVQLQKRTQSVILTICLLGFISQAKSEEVRQWPAEDSITNYTKAFCSRVCNEECVECTTPIKCSEGQTKCGEASPKDHPDCYPDEICVPKGCNC